MREWEIGAVENIHGALPYIRVAPILALVGVGVNRIGKEATTGRTNGLAVAHNDLAPYEGTLLPREVYDGGSRTDASDRRRRSADHSRLGAALQRPRTGPGRWEVTGRTLEAQRRSPPRTGGGC